MALIKCPDCGHDVSDRAPACVNCGAPIAAPATPPDVCEVVLRRISGLGIFGGARWILEGQVMTRNGITVVASCQYSSDNELANFQGSKREFHKARESITNQLLRAGWEPLASISSGDAISLPRFQRRSGVDKPVLDRPTVPQLSPEDMHEVELKALAKYLMERDLREEAELEAAGAVSEWPDEWYPTHLVPKGGSPFWASSDRSQRPSGQLPGEVELMMEDDPESDESAQVTAMNGWKGWVDGRLLEEVPDQWEETHLAPAGGMGFWKAPDPVQPPTGKLPGRTRLVLNSRSGAWANVTAANGWRGWVDGRLLEKCD